MPPTIAHPGLPLGPSSKYTSGPGTHLYGLEIHASRAGAVLTTPAIPSSTNPSSKPLSARPNLPNTPNTPNTPNPPNTLTSPTGPNPPTHSTLPTLSIPRAPLPQSLPSRLISATNILPAVGDVVLARVTRLQTQRVTVSILVVGETVCADGFAGVVRREDVRGWEVDRVVCGEGFRVGDVVRGVVISLGDQASYYLSTARNELGVIMATSEDGNEMYPISWKEFKDPVTGKTESRKVAKPF